MTWWETLLFLGFVLSLVFGWIVLMWFVFNTWIDPWLRKKLGVPDA